jgi:hypothetical protein
VLEKLVNALVDEVGGGTAFSEVQTSPLYKGAMEALKLAHGADSVDTNPLLMAFGFVKETDPWGGVLKDVMAAIVVIFQTISGTFLYGCDVFKDDPKCGDLPSLRNEVLSNSLK